MMDCAEEGGFALSPAHVGSPADRGDREIDTGGRRTRRLRQHGVRRSERGECGGAAGEDAGNRIKAYHQGVQATTDHTGTRDSGEGSMKGA